MSTAACSAKKGARDLGSQSVCIDGIVNESTYFPFCVETMQIYSTAGRVKLKSLTKFMIFHSRQPLN
jgi:hypothetical protein